MYDRKTWIVLVICGALLAANFYFSSENQKAIAAENNRKLAEQQEAAALVAETAPPPSINTGETAPPPAAEQLIVLENSRVAYTLTTKGGGIKFAEFKNEYEVGSKTERVRANRYGIGPIGAIAGSGEALDIIDYTYKADESEEGRKAVFIARHPSGLIAKKTFTLNTGTEPGSSYLIDFDLKLENTNAATLNASQWSLFMGEAAPLYQAEFANHTGFFWHEDGDMHFKDGGKFKGGWFSSAKPIITSPSDHRVDFAGVTNQFFTTVLRPREPGIASVWAKPETIALKEGGKALTSVSAGLHLPATRLETGKPTNFQYRIFIGPKHNPMLRKMESHWGKGWGDLMQYGWFWWVSRPLNFLLNTYHTWLDGIAKNWSWGLAIILLTITVRIFIWPLHAKSTRTMKRMSKLQPEMAKLKEKYPDDPQKLNTEMMGLYRKFGINPLGGCLPMFLQIPIFFGFFRMLQYAVEFRNQPFLWVQDLSQPDTLTHIAGIPINILPIVMGLTSFLQIAITPKTGDKMQQRIMLFMPLIFFIFCYNFASALALYWTTQNIFSIGQTWLMNKIPEPELKARKDSGKKSWVQRMAERQAELQRMKEKGGSPGDMRNVTPDAKKKPRPPRTGG